MLLSPPNLPAGDRPRERLWALGPAALTTAELVAILIGTGGATASVREVSGRLLEVSEGALRRLALFPWSDRGSEQGRKTNGRRVPPLPRGHATGKLVDVFPSTFDAINHEQVSRLHSLRIPSGSTNELRGAI